MMRKAADKGLCVIFNPSPVNAALADYPLESVSWFLLNEIEAGLLTGQTDPQAILAGMKRKHPVGVRGVDPKGRWRVLPA